MVWITDGRVIDLLDTFTLPGDSQHMDFRYKTVDARCQPEHR